MEGMDSFGDDYENLPDGESPEDEVNEEPKMCSECGGMLNEEGSCNECGGAGMYESKKKTLRLKESEMLDMIQRIVKESVPGITVTKKAQDQSKKDNESNASDVAKKIKGATTFDGNDNPEFPKPIGKGEKVARKNTPEQEEEEKEDEAGGDVHCRGAEGGAQAGAPCNGCPHGSDIDQGPGTQGQWHKNAAHGPHNGGTLCF